MKLSTKLTLSILGLTVLLAPLLGWLVYVRASEVLASSLRAEQLRAAHQSLETIDRTLNQAHKNIRILATDPDLELLVRTANNVPSVSVGPAQLQRINAQRAASVQRKAALTGPWEALLVINSAGKIAVTNDPQFRGISADEHALLRQAWTETKNGRAYISDVVQLPQKEQPTVVFAAPVHDSRMADSPVIGAVVGLYTWATIIDILAEAREGTRLRLANRDGLLIGAHAETGTELLKTDLRTHPALAPLLADAQRSEHFATVTSNATARVAFAVRQRGYQGYLGSGWLLLLEAPASQVTGPMQRLARDIALAVTALMAVMAVCFYFVGRRLMLPLNEVTQLTGEFAAGRLDRRARVRTRDEAGQLAAAFNRMADQIDQNTTALEREIAERRKVEGELQAAKENAEEASRAKSDFLARMSHEIRTPMNGILGMAELAMDSRLPPAQQRYIENIRSSGQALLTLINDVLDFSKIEAGKLEIAAAPFSLRSEVGLALRTIAIRAQEKNVELLYHVRSRVPDSLTGDALRLRQVMLNLVGNAIKFTDRGSVKVKVELVDEPLTPPAAHGEAAQPEASATPPKICTLRFSVTDTGAGIPPAQQVKIFEAFTQADVSVARTHGGTGLGLSIAAQLVQLMGGRLGVESVVGQGSTFHFTLPFFMRAEPPPALQPDDLRGLAALIVDDSAATREILEENLGGWGMRPKSVASGEAALAELRRAAAAREPYTLVFLDVEMPGGMNGLEVAEAMRHDPALAATPIVIISLTTRPEDLERMRALRIDAHHAKPFIPSDLLTSIQTALRSGPGLPETFRPASDDFVKVPPLVAERAPRPLRILVAEDTRINQEVVQGMLSPRGHTLVLAHNGAEAVARFQRERFDLILMDMHMPEMDGITATQEIRRLERERGITREAGIRIVALTANAIKGDRERCLAAGMDGYLSKPVDRHELLTAVEAAPPAREENPTVAAGVADAPGGPPVDLAQLQEQLGGDPATVRELITVMLEDLPAMLERIEQGMAAHDSKAVHRGAHSLKSALKTFGATEPAALAQNLETLGRNDTWTGAVELHEQLIREVAIVRTALERHLATTVT